MITKIRHKLLTLEPTKFTPLLAIFFMITHFKDFMNHPAIPALVALIAAIGLLFENARGLARYWAVLTALYAAWVVLNWQLIDNHMYLWGYWLLAITLSHFSKNKAQSLMVSAQYLIASCMVYAIIQKMNPTFLSGDFFYFQLLTDSRFTFIGKLIQFNMVDLIVENKLLMQEVMTNAKTVRLTPGPHVLHIISQCLTWYVIAIEAALALVFLLPRRVAYAWQHWLMLLFLSTYFILPIKGFAFALLSLSFTLIKPTDAGIKLLYLCFMLYIFSFSVMVVNVFF